MVAGELNEESTLAARLRAGDRAAFEHLVRTHGGRVLAVARRYVRNEDDARDCVQDAFLQAFQNIERFEGRSTLATWLHRIVVNVALGRLRTRRRRPEVPVDDARSDFDRFGNRLEAVDSGEPPAESLLDDARMERIVRECIEQLPDPYREIIMLRDIDELDTAETAAALGLSNGAVKTRLHRARAALKRLLEPRLRGAGS